MHNPMANGIDGGTLAGTGVINDNATVLPGAGSGNGSIGTFTVSSNLTLAGVVSMDIDKSHAGERSGGRQWFQYEQ
jgi:hypothetical protein